MDEQQGDSPVGRFQQNIEVIDARLAAWQRQVVEDWMGKNWWRTVALNSGLATPLLMGANHFLNTGEPEKAMAAGLVAAGLTGISAAAVVDGVRTNLGIKK